MNKRIYTTPLVMSESLITNSIICASGDGLPEDSGPGFDNPKNPFAPTRRYF